MTAPPSPDDRPEWHARYHKGPLVDCGVCTIPPAVPATEPARFVCPVMGCEISREHGHLAHDSRGCYTIPSPPPSGAEKFNALCDQIAALRAEVERLKKWQRDMVAKAAEKSLDGYRALGARAAAAENQRDTEKARADAAELRTVEAHSLAKGLRAATLNAEAERDALAKVIEGAWRMIECGWSDNIESRAEWERRYPGFEKGEAALGMAIHAAGFKRDTKAEAERDTLREAIRVGVARAEADPTLALALLRMLATASKRQGIGGP